MNERKPSPIEKRVDLWSDAHGLQAFVQYGRLHVQLGDMVLAVFAHDARRPWQQGVQFHLRDSGQLVIQPEATNVVVLRKEDA